MILECNEWNSVTLAKVSLMIAIIILRALIEEKKVARIKIR